MTTKLSAVFSRIETYVCSVHFAVNRQRSTLCSMRSCCGCSENSKRIMIIFHRVALHTCEMNCDNSMQRQRLALLVTASKHESRTQHRMGLCSVPAVVVPIKYISMKLIILLKLLCIYAPYAACRMRRVQNLHLFWKLSAQAQLASHTHTDDTHKKFVV